MPSFYNNGIASFLTMTPADQLKNCSFKVPTEYPSAEGWLKKIDVFYQEVRETLADYNVNTFFLVRHKLFAKELRSFDRPFGECV